MTCVGSLAPISLVRNGPKPIMAEAVATTTTVSRRSTRLWAGDGEALEKTPQSMASDLKYSSSSDDDKEMASPEKRPAPGSPKLHMIPGMDLGVDISGMFPATSEDLGKQSMATTVLTDREHGLTRFTVSTCLQESNTCKSMLDGKPLNFGAVLPGSIYRSSFPAPENLPFLGTLGLKTILSVLAYHSL
jgi:tyrosine-protein phosphatase SIW14